MPSQEQRSDTYSRTCSEPASAGTTATAANLQPYGNQAAQEGMAAGLQGEPVDVVAYDAGGDHVIVEGRLVENAFGAEGASFADFDGMVDSILAQAGGRQIGILMIYAHAESGLLMLGEGQDIKLLNRYDLPSYEASFSRLAGHFAPGGHVEIHGCNFAQYDGGEVMISTMSQIWGVPVSAGREVQHSWTPGLDGTTVTARPDGQGGSTLTEEEHPIVDDILRGCDWTADRAQDLTKEVGGLWNWVFGEGD